ncbi:uncharacterized protein LOC125041295 [Penaeus chinensis]|uniref:uncharacterized protein LOC125041295 n=1 Tax=Penaeus chinensis TaxID=139456 RepID=UPI001FB834B2|nr:uncharacterized protein LOC125041295 [Penaeus chinensis]
MFPEAIERASGRSRLSHAQETSRYVNHTVYHDDDDEIKIVVIPNNQNQQNICIAASQRRKRNETQGTAKPVVRKCGFGRTLPWPPPPSSVAFGAPLGHASEIELSSSSSHGAPLLCNQQLRVRRLPARWVLHDRYRYDMCIRTKTCVRCKKHLLWNEALFGALVEVVNIILAIMLFCAVLREKLQLLCVWYWNTSVAAIAAFIYGCLILFVLGNQPDGIASIAMGIVQLCFVLVIRSFMLSFRGGSEIIA